MQAKAGLSLDTLVQFDWEVALGGKALTRQELEALARQKGPLVRLRGQWVQLDAREIEAALDFWKQQGEGKAQRARDVVRMALGADARAGRPDVRGRPGDAAGSGTSWRRCRTAAALQAVPLPERLRSHAAALPAARLLLARTSSPRWGLGACLADDMGLGKTSETLAFLARRWQEGDRRPALVICPTSVVGNWQREAQRSRPTCPCWSITAWARRKDAAFAAEAGKHALVLSSYALLHRDLELLKAVEWAGLVLDEAQNIKNPETKQVAGGPRPVGRLAHRPDRHAGREPRRRPVVDHGVPQPRLPGQPGRVPARVLRPHPGGQRRRGRANASSA